MSNTASKVILPDGTEVTLTDGGCRTKGYFKSVITTKNEPGKLKSPAHPAI